MFFHDSTGFFSLVSLLIQCMLAWIVAGFLAVLGRRLAPSPWLRHWCRSFTWLAVGLSALTVRFLLAYHYVSPEPLTEQHPATRALYALYFAGKLAFAWHLVAGARALARRRWPVATVWTVAGLLLASGAVATTVPTIEAFLLLQAPLQVAAFAHTAALLFRHRDGHDLGARIAATTLAIWGAIWCVYAAVVIAVDPFTPQLDAPIAIVLRCNSLIDVIVQVVLGASLIVLVLQDLQRTALTAIEERDRLRDQLQRDERLRALSTLVGGVAHELNNPLTAILGFGDDLDDHDQQVRSHAARIVREQAERCRAIVQRLSVLGRRGDIVRAPVELGQLAERVIAGFEPQLRRAGVTVHRHLQPATGAIAADSAGLEQILANLLSNALHASPAGGVITVTTQVTADVATVSVTDQGQGVPAQDRGRIFEPFFTSKPEGIGSGLGLPVALAMAQAHGGSIGVDDAPHGGARFTVTLPRRHAAPCPPTPAGREGDRQPDRLRLLIVDDEALVRTLIARHAQATGWETAEADSAEAALPLLADQRFDAIVCDLRMPGIAGIGLYDHLMRTGSPMRSRMVFITGDLTSSDAAAFARRCGLPILGKPFTFPELLGRLRAVACSA